MIIMTWKTGLFLGFILNSQDNVRGNLMPISVDTHLMAINGCQLDYTWN